MRRSCRVKTLPTALLRTAIKSRSLAVQISLLHIVQRRNRNQSLRLDSRLLRCVSLESRRCSKQNALVQRARALQIEALLLDPYYLVPPRASARARLSARWSRPTNNMANQSEALFFAVARAARIAIDPLQAISSVQ